MRSFAAQQRNSSPISLLIILCFCAVDKTIGRLQPAENVFPTDVNKALLPNIRKGLNDCHLRYHKYGDYNLVYPIFGVPARIGEFAHMAAIGWTGSDGNVDFSCGGSLITTRHVLTSAHCASRDGVPPDVVRVGMININVSIFDPSNKFAQQYKIASFKRHPDHKFVSFYHDIAIITVEGEVTINDVVTPACLWSENDVEFSRLEAVGFGQTSFAGNNTPILLKVQLSPISNEVCRSRHPSGNRKLRQGIIDSQICARDSKMDTCLGDSGGPLQAKLMSNHRTTPYVVGITSFGLFCGTEAPSVYTRVSSYIPWIEGETGQSFNPGACSARYINLREADESMVASRAGTHVFIEPEKSYMDIEVMPKHRVYLGYRKDTNSKIQWNCGGVLINEDYVLTVAHCDKFVFDQTPSYVKVGDLNIHNDGPRAQIIKIERFTKHPNYMEGFMENDIALVKLKTDVKIDQNAVPACIVDNDLTMPMYEMAGLGPFNLNNFLKDDEAISKNTTLVLTRMRVDPTRCQRGNSDKIMCAKNNKFLVPQTCRIEHGGPVERETWHFDRYFQYVFGLTVAGKDCGFGSEAYFVRTAAHIEWIESVVLGRQKLDEKSWRRAKRQIVFPGEYSSVETALGRPCTTVDNTQGTCEYYRSCSTVTSSVSPLVKFCSHGANPIVCCRKPTLGKYTLKKCVSHWKQHKQSDDEEYENIPSEGRPFMEGEYPHVAFVGISRNSNIIWSCTGVLISDLHVLTSGSCVKSRVQNIVRVGAIELGGSYPGNDVQDVSIDQIMAHPSYDPVTSKADLALIFLASSVQFSSKVLPVCIWPNHESVPLKLYTLGVDEAQMNVRPRLSKYNQDCRKFYQLHNLADGEQLCAENYYVSNNSCQDRSGDPVEAMIAMGNIKMSIVVGLTAYSSGCPGGNQTVTVYTRLSAYTDWIKSFVES